MLLALKTSSALLAITPSRKWQFHIMVGQFLDYLPTPDLIWWSKNIYNVFVQNFVRLKCRLCLRYCHGGWMKKTFHGGWMQKDWNFQHAIAIFKSTLNIYSLQKKSAQYYWGLIDCLDIYGNLVWLFGTAMIHTSPA